MTITNQDSVEAYLESFDKQARAIKQEVTRMCWYMRGGVTYAEAMNLGFEERKVISDLIKENIETTKKSGLPFF